MSLISRHLETAAIPTVVIGSARDVVEYCGVARFLYTDFPLGNPCGKPYDKAMQLDIIQRAVNLLQSAGNSQTTEQTPYVWSDDESWRERYLMVNDNNRQQLALQGEQRRQQQVAARAKGESRAPMISNRSE